MILILDELFIYINNDYNDDRIYGMQSYGAEQESPPGHTSPVICPNQLCTMVHMRVNPLHFFDMQYSGFLDGTQYAKGQVGTFKKCNFH